MRPRSATITAMLIACLAGVARADVIVSFDLKDTSGAAVTGEVAPGTRLVADILVFADETEATPIADVRSFQFSFSETSPALTVENFTWLIPQVYGFQINDLPTPAAITLLTSSSTQLISITTEPTAVASVEIVANSTGTLDVRGAPDATRDFVALLYVDFEMPFDFSTLAGNLSGGTLGISVSSGGNGGPPTDDRDGDGVPDDQDAFPDDPTESVDTDGDGIGDVADTDDDGDGIDDDMDDFPLDATETTDSDNDGVGDNSDAFPLDDSETSDADGDGVGDIADTDDDNDGVSDDEDAFPLDPTETTDADGNGIGDNADAAANDSNQGPVAGGTFCGMGMLGSLIFMFSALSLMRTQNRWFRRGR